MSLLNSIKSFFGATPTPTAPAPTSFVYPSEITQADPSLTAQVVLYNTITNTATRTPISNLAKLSQALPNDLISINIAGTSFFFDTTLDQITSNITSPALEGGAWTLPAALSGYISGDDIFVSIDSIGVIFIGKYQIQSPTAFIVNSTVFDRNRFKTYALNTQYSASIFKLSQETSFFRLYNNQVLQGIYNAIDALPPLEFADNIVEDAGAIYITQILKAIATRGDINRLTITDAIDNSLNTTVQVGEVYRKSTQTNLNLSLSESGSQFNVLTRTFLTCGGVINNYNLVNQSVGTVAGSNVVSIGGVLPAIVVVGNVIEIFSIRFLITAISGNNVTINSNWPNTTRNFPTFIIFTNPISRTVVFPTLNQTNLQNEMANSLVLASNTIANYVSTATVSGTTVALNIVSLNNSTANFNSDIFVLDVTRNLPTNEARYLLYNQNDLIPLSFTTNSTLNSDFIIPLDAEINAVRFANQDVAKWSATVSYAQGYAVIGSDGNLYVALSSNANQNPTTTTGIWANKTTGGTITDYVRQQSFAYPTPPKIINSAGSLRLGAGATNNEIIELNQYQVYGSPTIDTSSVTTATNTILFSQPIFVGTTTVYITVTQNQFSTRLSPTASTFAQTYANNSFGTGLIYGCYYSGSGSTMWLVTSVADTITLNKIQVNANGTVTILGVSGALAIYAASGGTLVVGGFAVSNDSGNGIMAIVGSGTTGQTDSSYLYFVNYTLAGALITLSIPATANLQIPNNQLQRIVASSISASGNSWYVSSTTNLYQVVIATNVRTSLISIAGQPDSMSVYAGQILISDSDSQLSVYNIATGITSVISPPNNFIYTTFGLYGSWVIGSTYYFYAEGRFTGTVNSKWYFSFQSVSGLKTLQALVLGGTIIDNNSSAPQANQYLTANASGSIIWQSFATNEVLFTRTANTTFNQSSETIINLGTNNTQTGTFNLLRLNANGSIQNISTRNVKITITGNIILSGTVSTTNESDFWWQLNNTAVSSTVRYSQVAEVSASALRIHASTITKILLPNDYLIPYIWTNMASPLITGGFGNSAPKIVIIEE